MPEIPVEYGNMEGQYFTQWRIDLLNEFLCTIVFAYCDTPLVAVEDVKIWYDAAEDFHRMTFTSAGKRFAVQFYKVFSVTVDGADLWRGCLLSSSGNLAKIIRDEIRKQETPNAVESNDARQFT
jgi:hypothetical protein